MLVNNSYNSRTGYFLKIRRYFFQHRWWQHSMFYFGAQQKGSQFCHSSWFKKPPAANNRSEFLHLQSEALCVLLGQFFSCYKPTELHWRQFGFVKCHELRADVFVFHCPLNLPLRLIQSLHLKEGMEHSPQLELYPGMEQVEQVDWMPLTVIPLLQKSPWGKAEVNTRSREPVPTSHDNSWPQHPPLWNITQNKLLSSDTDQEMWKKRTVLSPKLHTLRTASAVRSLQQFSWPNSNLLSFASILKG